MPLKDRDQRNAYERARRARNPEREAELQRAQRDRNPEAFREMHRASRARKAHGRSIAEVWAAMWEQQGGCCYLCGTALENSRRQVHVDHDHRCCPSQKSCERCRRGLVCRNCNWAIGFAADDPARLRRMADSLEAAQLAVTARLLAGDEQLELLETGS